MEEKNSNYAYMLLCADGMWPKNWSAAISIPPNGRTP